MRTLAKEVQDQDPDYVLNVSQTDFVRFLVDKYSLDVPVLDAESIYIHQQNDVRIDITGPYRDLGRRPVDRPGTEIVIAVPFSGDPDLFDFHPSQWNSNPPRARVGPEELFLVYRAESLTAEEVRTRYLRDLADIAQ